MERKIYRKRDHAESQTYAEKKYSKNERNRQFNKNNQYKIEFCLRDKRTDRKQKIAAFIAYSFDLLTD